MITFGFTGDGARSDDGDGDGDGDEDDDEDEDEDDEKSICARSFDISRCFASRLPGW
jgi:hypothetical protein